MTELERIKKTIKKSGFTQNEFAEKLNLKTRTFANYLSGHTKLDIEVLKKIAKLLQVPVSYFFDENVNGGHQINGKNIINGSNNNVKVTLERKERKIEHLEKELASSQILIEEKERHLEELRQRVLDKEELIEMYKNQ